MTHRGLPFGLASSSQGNWVDVILTILKVKGRFKVVMSGDMVTDGKPHPEIYLTAAEQARAWTRQGAWCSRTLPTGSRRERRRG